MRGGRVQHALAGIIRAAQQQAQTILQANTAIGHARGRHVPAQHGLIVVVEAMTKPS
jgi:hypothetical protein